MQNAEKWKNQNVSRQGAKIISTKIYEEGLISNESWGCQLSNCTIRFKIYGLQRPKRIG